MCGGNDAGPYSSRFEVGTPNEHKVALSEYARLPAGAVIAYQHGGGAGFGTPLERDPHAVKEDVLDEKVSIEAARDAYGVVFTGSLEEYDLQVDDAARPKSCVAFYGRHEGGHVGYRVGIDIGGTFTDFALLKSSDVVLHKNLSTPEDRSIGVMSGLGRLAQMEGLPLEEFLHKCDAIVHATTIADNTLIEMNGALTGLITTEGFRDEIEYRRGFKEDIWDVRLPAPLEITPRRRRLTVPERILFDGSIYKPLDESAVRECCRKLRKQNVEAVAICLIFSFVNPAHERRVAEIVAEEIPNAHISTSHRVLPRAPEYDRTSTTVVNAYIRASGDRVLGKTGGTTG